MMIRHHRTGDNGNGPDRVIMRRKLHWYQPIQPLVVQEIATEPDEDPGGSGRQQRSRLRDRAYAQVPPYACEKSATV